MSSAKRCDRCGAFYKPCSSSRVVCVYFEGTTAQTKYSGDICPKCAKKYEKWWTKQKRKGDEQ